MKEVHIAVASTDRGATFNQFVPLSELGITSVEEAPTWPAEKIEQITRDETLSPEARAERIEVLMKTYKEASEAYRQQGGVNINDAIAQAVVNLLVTKYNWSTTDTGDSTPVITTDSLVVTQIGDNYMVSGRAVMG